MTDNGKHHKPIPSFLCAERQLNQKRLPINEISEKPGPDGPFKRKILSAI
jgi:hypothetical protein